jgi:hypothetical protein
MRWRAIVQGYAQTLSHRGLHDVRLVPYDDRVECAGACIWADGRLEGTECPQTDDLRDFLFKHGIRCYTKRRFRKLGGQA